MSIYTREVKKNWAWIRRKLRFIVCNKIDLRLHKNWAVFSDVADVVAETKDVDLRVLHPIVDAKAAPVSQKRPSTELLDGKPTKKTKLDKFDV